MRGKGREGRDVHGEARGEGVCIVWLLSGYATGRFTAGTLEDTREVVFSDER